MILALLLAVLPMQEENTLTLTPQQQTLIDAMIRVESGGDDEAIGDDGNAIGCLQIWDMYWVDAMAYDKTIGGFYEDCFNRQYSIRVLDSYMRRYAKEAWTNPEKFDPEKIARIHNGGPRGYKKRSTQKYWAKVQARLWN